jgi:hypothetical protein
MNNNTVLTYKLNGSTYRHVFAGRVSYGTVERYLIMEKRIGLRSIPAAIVSLTGLA